MAHAHSARQTALAIALLVLLGPLGCHPQASKPPAPVRIATFNTALSRDVQGALHLALALGEDSQARLVAEVIQRTRPDIVLLQEIDSDPTGKAYADFQNNYLAVAQNGAAPIRYQHAYAPAVNTGELATVDLDGDGKITRPNDCHGFGLFPGHYGMVLLSRFPIAHPDIQTCREVLWRDALSSAMPQGYYSEQAEAHLRLSSKTHARVPVRIDDTTVELLISHPTPPVFDGPEDRNGRRNEDEIRLWAYLLDPGSVGKAGEYPPIDGENNSDRLLFGTRFVVMGDLNADPNDGASRPGAIDRLLMHPRINPQLTPTTAGGREAARLQGGKNKNHKSDPAADTADFDDGDRGPGNLRVDYVLPGRLLSVFGSGVYWPTQSDPHAYLNQASDHRLVWIDVLLD